MGQGSYGDYKDNVVSGTIEGIGFDATNICANSKDGTVRLNARQFVQIKSETGYILNTASIGIKSLKVYTLAAKDKDFGKTVITIGSEQNPSEVAQFTTSTESVTVSGYDGDTDVDLNVYTVDVTSSPKFFKLSSSAAIWVYKIEIEY